MCRRGRVQATGARSGGREATGGAPKDGRRGQAWAHASRSEGKGTGKAPRPAAAERGQSTSSGRRDAGHGAGKGQGHGRDRGAGGSSRGWMQGPEQGAKTGGHGAHGAEQSAVGERSTAKDMGKDAGRIQAPAVRARTRVTEDGTRDVGRKAKA